MDDLRDYRFYDSDMLHLSETAIEYIWKAFSDCYFNPSTCSMWKEINSITKAVNHRFISDSISAKNEFAGRMLKQIGVICKKYKRIDLTKETEYFRRINSII
jgi:hypothetical protein